MLRYWYLLLSGRFKVWHLVALGVLWIAGALVLHLALARDLGAPADAGIVLLLVGSGVAHFVIAARAVKEHDQLDAKLDELDAREAALANGDAPPRAPKPPVERPRPAPPRLGDDPFREPPRAPPIVVERPRVAAATPMTTENPDDKPKILT